MNKIWLIIRREYSTRVKKKSFIIMTFLGPILFAGLLASAIFLTLSDKREYTVLIDDQDKLLSVEDTLHNELVSRFADRFKSSKDSVRYFFSQEDLNNEDFLESPYTIMVKVPAEVLGNAAPCPMFFKNVPGFEVKEAIQRELENALEQAKVVDSLKMKYEDYKRIKVNVRFAEFNAEKMESDYTHEKAMIGFVFAVIIYFFIFLYGVQVMRGVIEEKTNRIVEVIISSVKPFQLMMGKVVGIGLVGLTQFLMWVVLSALVSSILLSAMPAQSLEGQITTASGQTILNGNTELAADFQEADRENGMLDLFFRINWPLMIGMFIFYFIGGYMIYASLFAAVGAAVDNETDTQQFMMPITIPLIFGFIVSEFLIANPESTAGNIFSLIPLTSPVVMMVKTAIGCPPWQMITSMVLLVVTFVLMVWLAGRIYRVGILMYGKKATYKELWKWLRYQG